MINLEENLISESVILRMVQWAERETSRATGEGIYAADMWSVDSMIALE